LSKIIKEENLEVNKDKTMLMRPHQRQMVTGVLLNNREIRISRKDIRNFRAFLHQYTLVGEKEMDKRLGKSAKEYAKGFMAYIQMVNPEQADKFRKEYDWL